MDETTKEVVNPSEDLQRSPKISEDDKNFSFKVIAILSIIVCFILFIACGVLLYMYRESEKGFVGVNEGGTIDCEEDVPPKDCEICEECEECEDCEIGESEPKVFTPQKTYSSDRFKVIFPSDFQVTEIDFYEGSEIKFERRELLEDQPSASFSIILGGLGVPSWSCEDEGSITRSKIDDTMYKTIPGIVEDLGGGKSMMYYHVCYSFDGGESYQGTEFPYLMFKQISSDDQSEVLKKMLEYFEWKEM